MPPPREWHIQAPVVWSVVSALAVWIVTGMVKFGAIENAVFQHTQWQNTIGETLSGIDSSHLQRIEANQVNVKQTLEIVRKNQWMNDLHSKQLQRIENAVENARNKNAALHEAIIKHTASTARKDSPSNHP